MERQKLTPEMVETQRAHGIGKSVAAYWRFANRCRGTLYTGKPGEVIEMSGGREYAISKDGSIRRLTPHDRKAERRYVIAEDGSRRRVLTEENQ